MSNRHTSIFPRRHALNIRPHLAREVRFGLRFAQETPKNQRFENAVHDRKFEMKAVQSHVTRVSQRQLILSPVELYEGDRTSEGESLRILSMLPTTNPC